MDTHNGIHGATVKLPSLRVTSYQWIIATKLLQFAPDVTRRSLTYIVKEQGKIMVKKLTDVYLRRVAREELDTLDGVIDYAERMIREGDLNYRNLKRRAYGKTIIINRDKGGIATFRLGMDSLVYPNVNSGYATPHSPVGRLCAVAGMRYQGCSNAWGDYQVTEVRQFRRHDFEELERNARNFLAMGIENAMGQDKVMDLQAFVGANTSTGEPQVSHKQLTKVRPAESLEKIVPPPSTVDSVTLSGKPPCVSQLPEDRPSESKLADTLPPSPKAPGLRILDDDEEEGSLLLISDDEYKEDKTDGELFERMSLDEHFFLNRTLYQDKIISRAPAGPMWVEGIAGSGKTSAALGRTKMLCDFNTNDVSDRETFRAILGDDFDYWEGKFAGKFSQEGSVGFVRTAELIQYLKETCSRLGMPSLPVQEYHELRSRLRGYRQLETSGFSSKRFKHSSEEGQALTTTLAWLNSTRLAVARVIAADLRAQVTELSSENLQRFTLHQRRLFTVAHHELSAIVDEMTQELLSPQTAERVLHRFAANLLKKTLELGSRILGPSAQSIFLGEHIVHGGAIGELALRLTKLPLDLFLNQDQVLVLYQDVASTQAAGVEEAEVSPCASSAHYKFLSPDNETLSLNAALMSSRDGGKVRVLLPSIENGDGFEARFMPASELFILLHTPKTLLYLEAGSLKWLKVSNGVGSQALQNEDEKTRLSISKIFTQVALDQLFKPLKSFAGLYARALSEHASCFSYPGIARQTRERLEALRLSDVDIDLLLCLAHDLSAGVTSRLPSSLREPSYYQSVFVDEVQDFTEQQIYLMTSQADPLFSAITVVGDRSQQLLHNEEMHIADCFPIGQRAEFVVLDQNLRQKDQQELVDFSALLRQLFERDATTGRKELDSALLHDQQSVRGAYTLRGFATREEELEYACELIASIPEEQTVAVVLPDQKAAQKLHAYCEKRLEGSFRKMSMSEHIDLSKKYLVHFTSVLHVKGLEFDTVLLPMIDRYDLDQPVFRNRLYVGCTRARQRLIVTRLRPIQRGQWMKSFLGKRGS